MNPLTPTNARLTKVWASDSQRGWNKHFTVTALHLEDKYGLKTLKSDIMSDKGVGDGL